MAAFIRLRVLCLMTTALLVIAPTRVYAQSEDYGEPSSDRPIVDWKFLSLGTTLGAATAADTYSTYKSREWCPSCREDNPYAAPFINRGPRTAYAAGGAFDLGVMGVAAAMRKSSNPAIRKVWWAPPVVLIIGHGFAIRHNYGLRGQCRHDPRCGLVSRPGL